MKVPTTSAEILSASLSRVLSSISSQASEMAELFCREESSFVLVSGVGKSGIVASKLATSLTSIGVRAAYTSIENLYHGGLGAIRNDTTVVLISKSGEGSELTQILAPIKSKCATLLAITSFPECTLAGQADFTICIGAVQELDLTGFLPTTSTLLSLVAADFFLVEIAERLSVSEVEFLSNHPGGWIGQTLAAPLNEMMITAQACPVVDPSAKLSEVVKLLESDHLGGVLIVSSNGGLEGIFTDGDLRSLVLASGLSPTEVEINNVMNPNPIVGSSDFSVGEALSLMKSGSSRQLNLLPVVSADNELVGLVTLGMLLNRASPGDRN